MYVGDAEVVAKVATGTWLGCELLAEANGAGLTDGDARPAVRKWGREGVGGRREVIGRLEQKGPRACVVRGRVGLGGGE